MGFQGRNSRTACFGKTSISLLPWIESTDSVTYVRGIYPTQEAGLPPAPAAVIVSFSSPLIRLVFSITCTSERSLDSGFSGEPNPQVASRPSYLLFFSAAFLVRVPENLAPRRSCSAPRSEEHTSELQSLRHLVCR